jgi:hypothetical protein
MALSPFVGLRIRNLNARNATATATSRTSRSQRILDGHRTRSQFLSVALIGHEIGILTVITVIGNMACLGKAGNFGLSRVPSQADRIAITIRAMKTELAGAAREMDSRRMRWKAQEVEGLGGWDR